MTKSSKQKPFDRSTINVHELLAKRRQVAVVWSTEDVLSIRPDLDEDRAWEVLLQCDRIHDCEVGFTWMLIEYVADDLFPRTSAKGGWP